MRRNRFGINRFEKRFREPFYTEKENEQSPDNETTGVKPSVSAFFRDKTEIELLNKDVKTTVKLVTGPAVYGFDKIELVSKEDPAILDEKVKRLLRPIRKNICLHFSVKEINKDFFGTKQDKRDKYQKAYQKGYRSIIRFVCPEQEFFHSLIKNKEIFGQFKPWLIEICKDISFESTEESLTACKDYMNVMYMIHNDHHVWFTTDIQRALKKYGTKAERYIEKSAQKIVEDKEELYGNDTYYSGEDEVRLILYPRKSKLTNKACIHLEWRLMGKQIRKLGIQKKGGYFEALKNVSSSRIAQHYGILEGKYVRYCEINKVAVAKRILGLADNKKFTKGDYNSMELHYDAFVNAHHIENTADFVTVAKDIGWREHDYLLTIDLM